MLLIVMAWDIHQEGISGIISQPKKQKIIILMLYKNGEKL